MVDPVRLARVRPRGWLSAAVAGGSAIVAGGADVAAHHQLAGWGYFGCRNCNGSHVVEDPVEVLLGGAGGHVTVEDDSFTNQSTAASASDALPRSVVDDRNASKAQFPVSPADAQISPHSFSFDYHKPAFPLDWHHDGMTMLLAGVGLVIAASGGIGGGGILVPLFMLVLGFRPKHAIALSNFTILGGSIANTALNSRKRHPHMDRPLIDWDLILVMEPLTIFGAVFGSLMSKILPNIVLTVLLVSVLAFMGQRTLKKGVKMWFEESRTVARGELSDPAICRASGGAASCSTVSTTAIEMNSPVGPTPSSSHSTPGADNECASYQELQSDCEAHPRSAREPAAAPMSMTSKIAALTLCFVGTCVLTVLKGGGNFQSPLGFQCGSTGFWALYFGTLPWVLAFAIYFRIILVQEFKQKVRSGYSFIQGEVRWDAHNTIKYPALCAIAGLLAGLFGVGGGIVKGPLMLEMGIVPSVASASAAAMILYTSAAASTSFMVFGLLHPMYGAIFFALGVVCTAVGQYSVGQWVKKYKRQSPIVLSIGSVITLSSILVAVNTVASSVGVGLEELLRPHGVCGFDA